MIQPRAERKKNRKINLSLEYNMCIKEEVNETV